MMILNIIDKIYESKFFPPFLAGSLILLLLLFVIVMVMGIKDSKKIKEPKKEVEEEVKDITFETPKEAEAIKEDVTFEIPVLTENLENFKKNLEEEIQREDNSEYEKTNKTQEAQTKPIKILDMGEIEDTKIIPVLKIEEDEEPETEEENLFSKNEKFESDDDF